MRLSHLNKDYLLTYLLTYLLIYLLTYLLHFSRQTIGTIVLNIGFGWDIYNDTFVLVAIRDRINQSQATAGTGALVARAGAYLEGVEPAPPKLSKVSVPAICHTEITDIGMKV